MSALFVLLHAKSMQESQIEISIVMPCLNEEESLPYCLTKAFTFLFENNVNGEVIVVDNGSVDASAAVAKNYNAVCVYETDKGYGSAIMAGIEKASGKYIIIGDADDSYDFAKLMPFVELLRQGNDLVVGNRFKGGIEKGAMPFLHKYLGNPGLSFIGRKFFKTNIGDFLCGLRGISKACYDTLDLRTTGMEFGPEMIVKAALHNMKMAETPITLYPDKRSRSSHLKTWQDGWRNLRFLLLFSPRWLFLIPGFFLMTLGLVGTVALIYGPVKLGDKKLDVHTLVYTSAFILIGFQFISFYIFSRVYAAMQGLWPGQEKFYDRFSKYFKLERGIFIGSILFLSGILLLIRSFIYWEHASFGNLDPLVVLRWVVPSATLLVLGLQIVISFFYLSFLAIKSKSRKFPTTYVNE